MEDDGTIEVAENVVVTPPQRAKKRPRLPETWEKNVAKKAR